MQDIELFSCHTVNMKKETRTVFYNEDLQIEAYRFEGIIRLGGDAAVLLIQGLPAEVRQDVAAPAALEFCMRVV